jgi:hypothetical protein
MMDHLKLMRKEPVPSSMRTSAEIGSVLLDCNVISCGKDIPVNALPYYTAHGGGNANNKDCEWLFSLAYPTHFLLWGIKTNDPIRLTLTESDLSMRGQLIPVHPNR